MDKEQSKEMLVDALEGLLNAVMAEHSTQENLLIAYYGGQDELGEAILYAREVLEITKESDNE